MATVAGASGTATATAIDASSATGVCEAEETQGDGVGEDAEEVGGDCAGTGVGAETELDAGRENMDPQKFIALVKL